MPYIGKQPVIGEFVELDALTASATDTYTLTRNSAAYYPETVNNLLVSINGVIQAGSTMSLSGNTLTVGATLSSSDVIDFVRVLGNVGNVVTPTDGSVTSAKLDTNIAISGNLDVGTIRSTNGTTAATIDSSGRILQPAKPAFKATCAAQTLANSTHVIMTATTSVFNVGGHYSTTSKTFTAPVAGIYYFYGTWFGSGSAGRAMTSFYINGTRSSEHLTLMSNVNGGVPYPGSDTFQLSTGDEVQWYGYQESGGNVAINTNSNITHWGGYLVG